MPYATPSQFLARYDARRVGDLTKDDGTRATSSQLLTDTNLQAALDDASGLLDAACLRGQRYLPADLTGLSPSGNSYKFLVRLCCDLAYGYLVARRGYSRQEVIAQSPGYQEALGHLKSLSEGELVFDVLANEQAGLPHRALLSKQITLLSSLSRHFGDLDLDPNNPTMH